jgi:hypothetical protein
MMAKLGFGGPCIIAVMACAAWNTWKMRNDIVFQGKPFSWKMDGRLQK